MSTPEESATPSIFFEIHQDIPREGPGDLEFTRKAYSLLTGLPQVPRILDIGCGPGLQTIELAKVSGGRVTAVDKHLPFLKKLDDKAHVEGLSERVTTVNESMLSLSFANSSFDVIWSEGAIYIIGFERGLAEWKRLLTTNGYMIASHLSWLEDDIPEAPRKFWAEHFPEITTVEKNLHIASDLGFKSVAHFALPESAWWNDYYNPLSARLSTLRSKYKDNTRALAAINSTQTEIDLYRTYSKFYGYVFYIMQKNS